MRPTLERVRCQQNLMERVKPTWDLDPDLKLYVPFYNMGQGDIFLSQDAYGRTLTRYGATPTGRGGWSFDGVDDYVSAGVISYSGGALAIELWIYRNTDSVRILPIGAGYPPWQFNVGLVAANRVSLEIQINSVYYHLVPNVAPPDIIAGQWWHLAVSHDLSSGASVFYVNGIAYPGTTQAGSAYTGGGATIIGTNADLNTAWVNGLIGEVCIYNRALSAGDIWNSFQKTRGRYGV